MNRALSVSVLASASYVALISVAEAGTITAVGAVTALDNVNELQGIVGTGTFNEGANGNVPANVYAGQGLTWRTGLLTGILNGCQTPGSASFPSYQVNGNYFPGMIGGGGVANGTFAFHAGVATFDQPITQVGLTASSNGTQYLTAWDTNGNMIGQVRWVPQNDAAFIGIDTNGVPLGMIAYGNDDLWNGGSYGIGGSTIISDTWIWAAGIPCETDNDCADDLNPCTAPAVCQDGACLHVPDDNGICPDDNEPCTLDVCQNGACVHPNNPQGVCPDDGNMCTDDMCTNGVCSHPNNQIPCDDMDMCTENDVCGQGDCDGEPIVCQDQMLCTIDSCDPLVGCGFEWQMGCCLADSDCEPGQICLLGSNSCIPDPGGDGDGDGDGDGGDGDGDPGDGDPGDGDPGDGDPGDGDGDPGETGGTDTGSADGGTDTGNADGESGLETGGFAPLDDTGLVGDEGCNCASANAGDSRGAGGLLGLLGLALFGGLRRRRERS